MGGLAIRLLCFFFFFFWEIVSYKDTPWVSCVCSFDTEPVDDALDRWAIHCSLRRHCIAEI